MGGCRYRFGLLVSIAIGSFPVAAAAQTIPSSEQPGRQDERFIEQPAPKATPAGPTITLPSTIPPEGAGAIRVHVVNIEIIGSTIYGPDDLASLTGELVGHDVPLVAIYQLAQSITTKYGKDGYVLSRAIVPPQDIDPKGGVVTIKVIEGYVDAVRWPEALSGYRDFFSTYSEKITRERPANIKTIMRYLLLADDLPGFTVSSQFKASDENSGASTLIVDVTVKHVDAEARIDNRGTEARGPWEFLASTTANNVLGVHEALTATYAGAFETRELQYAALNWRQVLNSEGLTAFADASYSWGKPGTEALELLEFESTSLSIDLGLGYPVIRSRDRNLTLSSLFFLSNDQGDILAAPNSLDRLRGFRFKADFDAADSLNGITQVNMTFSQGIDGLGSTSNDNPLASRENGRVDFTKIAAMVSRVQPIGANISVRLAASAQYAFTPLLASEECGYGGRDFGRAFDPSEITGDSCWSVSSEVRHDLRIANNPLTLTQIYVFADYGEVFRIDPAAGTDKSADGASAGVGLRLGWKDRFVADLSAAKPLLGRDDDGWRTFLTATARY